MRISAKAERGVRPLKTQQKISGRLTSDDVTQDRLDIRGYIDTARKHGLGAHDVLHQVMLGNPWLPPAQPISPYQRDQISATVTRCPSA
jgi:transposase